MGNDSIRFGFGKKLASLFLSSALAVSAFAGIGTNFTSITADAAGEEYGLMDTCQEGVILHAWQWSFNNIKENMAKIAEAGYTSIQTSVIQQAKESTKGKSNQMWWVYYQPAKFAIDNTGNSALGTKAEFTAMCEEAHKYGIHVIVDVVANHLGNQNKYDISTAIPSDIRDDTSCWHTDGFTEINYNSRYSITHGSMGGLPDLNTENTKIQNYVINYLKECIDAGADGFRFDAAKHISIPSEGSEYTFWSNVVPAAKSYYKTNGTYDELYCYGEILGGTSGPDISGYTKYINVTDDSTGNDIRKNVISGNAKAAATSWYNLQAGADKSVLWAESHDTYSGDSKETTSVSESNINKTWALVASRNKATALYFARTAGYRAGNIGDIGSTQCFSKEVVEVNKFHNAFNGQSEYLAYSGSIAYNERGTSGVVLVNVGGGSTSVSVKANKMAAGTYKDQISGNTFTVSNGTISGKIGSTGIAVVYNPIDIQPAKVSVSKPSGTAFDDTITLNVKGTAFTQLTYSTSEGNAGVITEGKTNTITIGGQTQPGNNVTITFKYVDSSGVISTYTYVYYKRMASEKVTIYFDNTGFNWKQVYAYMYVGDGTTFGQNATWPGELMTYNADLKLYEIPVDKSLTDGYVIFTESENATTNRYPADMQPGLSIGGMSHLFYKPKAWEEYTPPVVEFTNTSTLAADTVSVGNGTTITASSKNGQGNVTYGVYYKKTSENSWTTKQNFSTNKTVVIKPAYPTTYDVCVKAKDETGTIVKKFFILTATVANGVISNTSTISADKIASGESITVNCASLATTKPTYAVYYKKSTDKSWVTKQNFSTNTKVTIKPTSDTLYDVCVKVKDSDGTIAKMYYKFTVTANAKSTLTNTSTVSETSIKAGSTLSVKCAGTGGKTSKTYAVYYKKSTDTKWATKQGFKANTAVDIKFSAAGSYKVCVKVKDSDGSIAKKYFDIKVS